MIKKNNKDRTKNKEKKPSLEEHSINEENSEEISKNEENNLTANEDLSNSENSEKNDLKEELINLKEEKLRLLAEMENLRKRFDKEKSELIKYGTANLIREILSPGDNLERALDAIPKDEKLSSSINNLIDGLKMVQKEFDSILENNGVKKINSLNKKFDHNYHQAMIEIEKDDVEEGTVVEEIQRGYTINERLLRPAMVGVSKFPANKKTLRKKEEEKNKENAKNEEK